MQSGSLVSQAEGREGGERVRETEKGKEVEKR